MIYIQLRSACAFAVALVACYSTNSCAAIVGGNVTGGTSGGSFQQLDPPPPNVGHVEYCGTNTVQVVNHIDPGEWPKLIERLPEAMRRVQVVHVEGGEALELISLYSPFVHAFLLDSGRPTSEVPELGGTGRVHDWDISARFVELSPKPVFLAGGINEMNAQQAISQVKPYGLDVCSSVRIDGKLSGEKLTRFMQSVL